jgi:hypothetical protein
LAFLREATRVFQDAQTIAEMEQEIDEKLWALRERESAEGEAAFDRMVI